MQACEGSRWRLPEIQVPNSAENGIVRHHEVNQREERERYQTCLSMGPVIAG